MGEIPIAYPTRFDGYDRAVMRLHQSLAIMADDMNFLGSTEIESDTPKISTPNQSTRARSVVTARWLPPKK